MTAGSQIIAFFLSAGLGLGSALLYRPIRGVWLGEGWELRSRLPVERARILLPSQLVRLRGEGGVSGAPHPGDRLQARTAGAAASEAERDHGT